jgi:hypothetical protein
MSFPVWNRPHASGKSTVPVHAAGVAGSGFAMTDPAPAESPAHDAFLLIAVSYAHFMKTGIRQSARH